LIQAYQAYQTALKPGEPDILNNLEIALAAQKNPAQSLLVFCNKLYKQGDMRRLSDIKDF